MDSRIKSGSLILIKNSKIWGFHYEIVSFLLPARHYPIRCVPKGRIDTFYNYDEVIFITNKWSFLFKEIED